MNHRAPGAPALYDLVAQAARDASEAKAAAEACQASLGHHLEAHQIAAEREARLGWTLTTRRDRRRARQIARSMTYARDARAALEDIHA